MFDERVVLLQEEYRKLTEAVLRDTPALRGALCAGHSQTFDAPEGEYRRPRAARARAGVLWYLPRAGRLQALGGGASAGQASVETPILGNGAIGGFVGRGYYPRGQGEKTAYDPNRLARDTLRAIERNKALLVVPRRAHASWIVGRLAPVLLQRFSIGFVEPPRARQAARLPAQR